MRLDVFTASGGGVWDSTPDGDEGARLDAEWHTMPLCCPRIAHRSDLAASRPFLETAMNTDFRISVTCARHPKIRKLIRRLGYEAFFSLTCLWAFAAAHKPNGDLNGMDGEDIELAAEWSGEQEAFVNALLDLRLLDVDEAGNMSIHDWRDHNGYAFYADARTAKAQKAASARWSKNSELMPADAQGNATSNAPSINEQCSEHGQAMPVDAPSNAPSPAPTPTPAPYSGIDGAERLPDGNHSSPPEPPPEPYGIDIPLVDGTSYAVTKADVAQWQDAYPGVDVPAELKRIRSWADSNAKKRKTRKGIRKHINGWLSTEQDRGGRNDRASPKNSTPFPMTAQQRYMYELGNRISPDYPEDNHDREHDRDIIDITPHDHAPPEELEAVERRIGAPCRALPPSGP